MSVYPPPTEDASIFNPSYFVSTAEGVTAAYVDLNYLKKAGGQTVVAAETFTGGILTNSITPSSGTSIGIAGDINATGSYKIGSTDVLTSTSLGSAITSSSLTSVGTLTSLNVSGDVTTTGDATFSGNIRADKIIPNTDTKVSVNSNIQVSGWVGCNTFQPTSSAITWNAYIGSGSPYKFLVPTLTGTVYEVLGKADSSGNSLQLGYTYGSSLTTAAGSLGINGATNPMLYFKNSQLGINTSSPSYTLHVNGDGYVSGALTVIGTIAGTLATAAQPNVTSVGTLTSLSVTGTVTAATLTGTLATAAQPNVTSVGTLTSLSVTGTVTAATLTGTLATAAQPNITSVGTLTSLSVSGTLTQTGAATFSTNITQSAGTASLKATTADSLTVSGTSTLATVTLNSPYFINMGGSLKMYGAVPITAYTLSQTSTGASPVYYTNTYTFSVTSTNMPLLSGTYIFGKLVVMVTTTGQQGYGEYIINKTTTTPTVTVFDAVQNTSWSSLTVTGSSATTLSVVVTQTNASTVPTVVTPTLQLMFTAYDY
jgi:hypothetical protein